MKILALDQATKISAWSVWQDGKPIAHGLLDFHKEESMAKRSDLMTMEIINLMYEIKPDLIAIEDVSYQRNAQALIDLARLQGRLMQAAYDLCIPVVIYKPAAWRKAVGIHTGPRVKRAELKQAAVNLVADRYQVIASDDIAEAICIGECAWKNLKGFKGV